MQLGVNHELHDPGSVRCEEQGGNDELVDEARTGEPALCEHEACAAAYEQVADTDDSMAPVKVVVSPSLVAIGSISNNAPITIMTKNTSMIFLEFGILFLKSFIFFSPYF